MEKQPIDAPEKHILEQKWQHFFKGCFLITGILVIFFFIYKTSNFFLFPQNKIYWQTALFLLALVFSLAWFLERIFFILKLEQKVHYRLSFWVAAAAPLLSALIQMLATSWRVDSQPHQGFSPATSLALTIISIGGSFLGSLTATIVTDGLWENNSPPPAKLERFVYQFHQARLGRLQPVPFWKRLFDIVVACLGLIISAPIWLLGCFLVWYEDPGPIFFVKNSVGRGGRNFHQLKLRTMIRGAEEHTGPIIAQQDDQRILISGLFFRKTALDELPQLLNIIKGEMSFVGPRPQRTVLVYQYLQHLPEYAERHKVLPGLAGLAQVAGDYYLTPRQKLRFDRHYIRYMSLGFDLKLLLLAFLITFWYRWQKDWNGRLPRKLIRMGKKSPAL